MLLYLTLRGVKNLEAFLKLVFDSYMLGVLFDVQYLSWTNMKVSLLNGEYFRKYLGDVVPSQSFHGIRMKFEVIIFIYNEIEFMKVFF